VLLLLRLLLLLLLLCCCYCYAAAAAAACDCRSLLLLLQQCCCQSEALLGACSDARTMPKCDERGKSCTRPASAVLLPRLGLYHRVKLRSEHCL
jgi:hypothetical protein